MPQRNIEGQYPYAYQGQEKDAETGMEAFELRLWDARLGRWLTTDPYGQYASPYLGMGNDPVNGIDPDGGWKTKWGRFWGWVGNGLKGSFTESENPATPWHKYGIRETSSLEGGGVLLNHKFGEGWKNEAINAGYTFSNGAFFRFQGVIKESSLLAKLDFWRNSPNENGRESLLKLGVESTYGTVDGAYAFLTGFIFNDSRHISGFSATHDEALMGFIDIGTRGMGNRAKKTIEGLTMFNKSQYRRYLAVNYTKNIKKTARKQMLKTHNNFVQNAPLTQKQAKLAIDLGTSTEDYMIFLTGNQE